MPPQVTDVDVTFAVPAQSGLSQVFLEVDRSLGGRIPFEATADGWRLRFPRPDISRLEYQIHFTGPDQDHSGTDAQNPRMVPGPFGAKSEILFPDYVEPDWMATPIAGELLQLTVPSPLETAVPLVLFTPHSLSDTESAPLVVTHDGTDFVDRGSLLRLACTTARPARVALLDPPVGLRNRWYGANPEYAAHIAGDVIPAVADRTPVSSVIGLGASLGAVAIMSIHQERPFDAMLLQSGSFFRPDLDAQESGWSEFRQVSAAVERWSRDAGPPVPVVVQVGTVEENRANNEVFALRLADQGFAVELELFRDAHNVIAWRDAWSPALDTLIEAAR